MKRAVTQVAKHLMLYHAGCLFQRSKRVEVHRYCRCGHKISQSHLDDSQLLDEHWADAAKTTNFPSGAGLKKLLGKPVPMITSETWMPTLAKATTSIKHRIMKLFPNKQQALEQGLQLHEEDGLDDDALNDQQGAHVHQADIFNDYDAPLLDP